MQSATGFRLVGRKYTGNVLYADIADRVKALQRELEEIREHNRAYLAEKQHDIRDQGQYREFRSRVLRIRAELYTLYEKGRVT